MDTSLLKRGPIDRLDCRRTRPPNRPHRMLTIPWKSRSRSRGLDAHDPVETALTIPWILHAGRQNEFMRRFLMHVLPKGFRRIRHFGFLANSCCFEKLARIRTALAVPNPSRASNPKTIANAACCSPASAWTSALVAAVAWSTPIYCGSIARRHVQRRAVTAHDAKLANRVFASNRNYPPPVFERRFRGLRRAQARVVTMTVKGLAPLSLAVSVVVRTSASASAAHMAR